MVTQCGNPSIRPRGAGRDAGGPARRRLRPGRLLPAPWSRPISAARMALGFATDAPGTRSVDRRQLRAAAACRRACATTRPEIHVAAFAHPAWMVGAGGPLAMARIAIGGLHHETNSFAPQPATFERFVEADGWPPLLRGAAMLPGTAGINLADHRLHRRRAGGRPRARAAGLGQRLPVGPGDARTRSSGWRRCCWPTSRPPARSTPCSSTCTAPWSPSICPTARASSCAGCARRSATLPIVAALDLHANLSEAMVAPQRRAGRLPHLPARRPRRHRCALPAAGRAAARRRALGQGMAAHRLPDPAALAVHDHRARPRALCAARRAGGGRRGLGLDLHGLSRRPTRRSAARRCWPTPPIRDRAEAAVDRLAAAFAAAEPRFAGRLWRPDEAVRARHAASRHADHPGRHPGQSGRRRQLRHDRPAGGADRGPRRTVRSWRCCATRDAARGRACGGRGCGPATAARSAAGTARRASSPIVGDFEVRAAGQRPVHRDRADVWRQPHGSRPDGAAALAGGAGRRGRRGVAAAAGGRPRDSASPRASIPRPGASWRSRARCISAPISRPWPRRC